MKDDVAIEDEVNEFLVHLSSAKWGTSDDQRVQVEELFEYQQVEEDGVLKYSLALQVPGANKTTHIFGLEGDGSVSKRYSVYNLA